ncbi:MAG: bifunctional hydroxymethylpyrimidine kinase/phosphomethylpyrimidine kinase [Thermodesulfovibrionales bacterium]|nr:bifunctional hydroxymethylpyrimidine kinase/phosphomethylpyrimidine kinase [Thermodesulfovibrionales bacterium]
MNLLSIAGFDPTSGAGIQADLKTFSKLGAYGLSVATAITIQNSKGVKEVLPVNKDFLNRQLKYLSDDFQIKGIKIGMIYSRSTVDVLNHFIKNNRFKTIVYDPVLVSSSGYTLTRLETLKSIIQRLIPLTTVITPNIKEAEAITGIHINSMESLKKVASELHKLGAKNVVITGGHFEEKIGETITLETIYDGDKYFFIKGKKIEGDYHGTGCVFSSALTYYITQGIDVVKATQKAKRFVLIAIKKSQQQGKGMRLLMI